MLEKEGLFKTISSFANLISSLYTAYYIGRNTWEVSETFYKSVWSLFEICYFGLNMTMSVVLIGNDKYLLNRMHDTEFLGLMDIQVLRIIESFLAIIIFMKLLYFM